MRRDPFARSEVERQTVTNKALATCQWCGTQRNRAFRYRRVTDSFRARLEKSDRSFGPVFCNLTCADAYYGGKI